MTYDDLIAYYGTMSKAAQARNISRQRVYNWHSYARIPTDDQIEYELVSKGKLRADLPAAIRRR